MGGLIGALLSMMASIHSPKPPRYVSHMYPTCIPHVFRMYMYSACIPNVSWLPLRIHVSRMYFACIPHVSFISDTSLSGCIWDTCISSCILDVSRMYRITLADTCISHVSRMYPASQIRTSQDTYDNMRYMYLACILEVFRMYPSCIFEPMQIDLSLINLACIMHVSCMYPQAYLVCIQRGPDEASKIHVSWLSILMYLDVSWWRVQDTRILMYPDMYPVWHQGSAQDTCILLYLICIPKMYLGLLWDTCKMSRYMYSLRM